MVPNTFLSLQKSNKIGIDFVQGKWNQGGSGAMKYCGQGTGIQLQLIVTRRNPEIIKKFPEHKSNNTPRKDDWSFTIIKRENLQTKVKEVQPLIWLQLVQQMANPLRGNIIF